MSDDLLLENYPSDLDESLAYRAQWRAQAAEESTGLEFIVSDLDRWAPGSTITIAFLDGSRELHRKVAETTRAITDVCNLTLDFGFDEKAGDYRRWSTDDTSYQADIRVSFDLSGYWSLVGTASVDPTVGVPHGAAGGRPNQRSLNLGGYDIELPESWRRTVLHEFLHALAFKHEHQNMRGPCQSEFRWDDDPGYVPTAVQGRFGTDSEGRRPGIYTFLSGSPNKWGRAKVDHNLRSAGAEDGIASEFDPASVMLYRFPPLFYRTNPSPCAPEGDGDELSAGDKRGLEVLYPFTADSVVEFAEQVSGARAALDASPMAQLESADGQADATQQLLDRLITQCNAATNEPESADA